MWLTKNKRGEVRLWSVLPARYYNIDWVPMNKPANILSYSLKIDDGLFPELTFENSPIEVGLIPIEKEKWNKSIF